MARKTKEEAAETRESVLLAALNLFSEKGYSRTTFSNIATSIGMTRGAVYWHFDNKSALLAALIEYVDMRKEDLVGMGIPDIRSLEDLRRAFVMHAQVMFEDETVRKFEFFLNYQMEWSQELLAETHHKLNEIRKNPLEEFKEYFQVPAIAERLRPDTDLDQLILTLAAFWSGLCKMRLGGCPEIDFGKMSESDTRLFREFDLEKTAGTGFDLILNGVLKEESENE